MATPSLEAIKYARGSLQLLDQRLLPLEHVYLTTKDTKDAWTQIRDMVVRGAPAIGCSAALSMAVELHGMSFDSPGDAAEHVNKALEHLATSRPTAVNLMQACDTLKDAASKALAAGKDAAGVVEAVTACAEAYFEEDVATNIAIGDHGAKAIIDAVKAKGGSGTGLRVMTHCNAGALATAGWGTAVGVIRSLHKMGALEHAYTCETRPYDQGKRLTAFELVYDKIPGTLICDSAAAYLMSLGKVDAVVVGADRVVANGDTANKIGTFSHALAAAHHGIPFFVAAPVTTLDVTIPTGAGIPIEERSKTEITHSYGKQVAPDGINVWNPGFDVCPGTLITGIVTEKGTVGKAKAGDPIDVKGFVGGLGRGGGVVSGSFYPLDETAVLPYVASLPAVAAILGGSPSEWAAKEVGDGNINFVYIVEGPKGGVVVKQALPFVRCVGESWPLTQDRIKGEAEALIAHRKLDPDHVPEVYEWDEKMAVIVMQYLAPPHIILRRGLMAGTRYPRLAGDVAALMARTLFGTSALAVPSAEFRENVGRAVNTAMCSLTEQVIFTDPYFKAEHNHHTSPQLDAAAAALYEDTEAKLAAAELKVLFIEKTQALIHGDLHTGSFMCTQDSTQMIDPEFAYYGPIGFDVGAFLANMLLSFFSMDGWAGEADTRADFRAWELSVVRDVWEGFRSQFVALWSARVAAGGPGDEYAPALFGGEAAGGAAALAAAQDRYMQGVWEDTLGFAGAKMVRRIVGIAHVADLDEIPDADARAVCQGRALKFGRDLMVGRRGFKGIDDVIARAEAARSDGNKPFFA